MNFKLTARQKYLGVFGAVCCIIIGSFQLGQISSQEEEESPLAEKIDNFAKRAASSQLVSQSTEPETLSIVETASLISKAEAIISPHGSGMLNTVFCEPGTKVIELFSIHLYRDCWFICNIRGCEYYSLYCYDFDNNSINQKPSQIVKNKKQDMFVNIDKLSQLMKIANLL